MDMRNQEIYDDTQLNESMQKQLMDLYHRQATQDEVDEEIEKQEKSGRLVRGSLKDLEAMKKRIRLSEGTKNQRKKYRQMQRDSRKKNRK